MVIDLLSEVDMTQKALSDATGSSLSYTNHVTTGRKLPSAQWLELVGEALSLSAKKRLELHKAAATDLAVRRGYKISE